jgi:hypothetical protein
VAVAAQSVPGVDCVLDRLAFLVGVDGDGEQGALGA